MNKTLLIIQREFLTRVKKKSFIIMTILGPLLMASTIVLPIWFSTFENEEQKIIAVIDHSERFKNVLENTETIQFQLEETATVEELRKQNFHAILEIPEKPESTPLMIYSDQHTSINTQNYIEQTLEKEFHNQMLYEKGIDVALLDSLNPELKIESFIWNEEGDSQKSETEFIMIIGFVAALVIYMFIFMYGAQIMRGVIEEKTNRIVEVLISSVKPFQLMAGKIVGIALVALTQFTLGIVLTFIILQIVQPMIMPESLPQTNIAVQTEIPQANDNIALLFVETIANLNIPLIIGAFLFYFLGGYLLYGSLFAAIGSAVDNETDSQQFMLPLTIPLILAFLVAQVVINDPSGPIAFWFSIIPFTSPVIMMVRIPFDTFETWELLLSAFLLVITFFGTTWVAAKIYRVGILMYGKKVSYKELWKWLKYSN